MNNKINKLFFILLSILLSICAYSQKISTDIYIDVQNREKNDNAAFGGKTIVKQVVYLDSTFVYYDSLVLKSENISDFSMMLQNYFFPSFQLSKNINYDFNGRELTISIPDTVKSFEIDFEFNTMFGFRSIVASFSMWAYMYDWDSWFFTCDSMKIANVSITIPDSTYFFSNLSYSINKNNYFLNTANLSNNNISFFILLQSAFQKKSFLLSKTKYDVFFADKIVDNPDSVSFDTIKLPLENINKKINFLQKKLQKINKLFLPKDYCHITI
ncbi:MAG: hypothetical protein LBS50_06590 [Prevotellaceae bacterium]|jgi:hypothetical protein|nr:hypothetical protein [Prevotellaceae bacterium]